MTLQAEIQALVSKFARDLEDLVRGAAVAAVRTALESGATSPRAALVARAPLAPGRKGSLTSQTRKAPQRTTAKRVRRTPEQMAATADQIAAYVKANPNSRAEQIKKALGIANNQWQGPLALLLNSKRLLARGEKRATTYNVAGASSSGDVVLLKRK